MVDRESRDLAKFIERSPRKPKKSQRQDLSLASLFIGGNGDNRAESSSANGQTLDLKKDLGLDVATSSGAPEMSKVKSFDPVRVPAYPPPPIHQSGIHPGSHQHQQQQYYDQQQQQHGNDGIFRHPVFFRIGEANGKINRMDLSQMKQECRNLNLDTRGKREALKRRLKENVKARLMREAGMAEEAKHVRNPDCFIVIDFEATCEERNPTNYQHEVIEFPAVLLSREDSDDDSSNRYVIADTFHHFCRPLINTELSEFCRELTGIEQATVDAAEPFSVVHDKFLEWLKTKHGLGVDKTFFVVTDGPFDMARFLYLQVQQLGWQFPDYGHHWINIRKAFSQFYTSDFYGKQNSAATPSNNRPPGLQSMLSSLGLEFEGRAHSGIDDARNIARVVQRLVEDGAKLRVNERIREQIHNPHRNKEPSPDNSPNVVCYSNKLKSVATVNRKEAEVYFRSLRKRVGKK